MSDFSKILKDEMEALWQWRIETDPELAASLGLLSKRQSTHALDPRSPSSFTERQACVQKALVRIQTLIPEDQIDTLLSNEDQLSYKLYTSQLKDYVTYSSKHKAYLCCINRLEGPQNDLPLYAKYLPLQSIQQRNFYKAFLQATPIQLDQIIELLTMGLEEQRTPPKISLDGVVSQIQTMVQLKCQAFLDPISSFQSSESDSIWYNECVDLVTGTNGICDAFTKLAHFLESNYIPKLRNEISAFFYPNGQSYYQDCLHFHTTTHMTYEEIHQLGLDEVSRIQTQMTNIATSQGFSSLSTYLEYLRTSPKYAPTSAQDLLKSFRDITSRISPSLLSLFYLHTLPSMPFQIVETPSSHSSTAPAAYYLAGSFFEDASTRARPGTFYVNTSELPTRRTYECESLALHEAIPGHHTQGSIQLENGELPSFRRYCEDRRYFESPCRFPFYTSYIEGWGLHSETLGKELGLYTEPESEMGQLSMEALRSCRLVVDTGMHAMGWSFEKALEYMLNNTAMGEYDAKTEVARYITWPGQATAYKVGERFIHRLRMKAESELGSKFDPRDFYDVVLQCGPVPLDILENLVDAYIRDVKSYVYVKSEKSKSDSEDDNISSMSQNFIESMSFATWCKCCVVPGSCQA